MVGGKDAAFFCNIDQVCVEAFRLQEAGRVEVFGENFTKKKRKNVNPVEN